MSVAVPCATPPRLPVVDPMVAMLVALLLQVPPLVAVASLNVVVDPVHTFVLPVIVPPVGVKFTVIGEVLLLDTVLLQRVVGFLIAVTVTVVLPTLERADVENVPVLVPIVSVAVLPVAELAPVKL